MEAWVGPAIIAAVVSGFVSAAGWFVTSWQAIRLERRRRAEKVRDFQVALRAEVASDLRLLKVADYQTIMAEVAAKYRDNPSYRPFVPHLATNVVFDAIVPELHILPGEVIEPVIRYARLRQVLSSFIEDLRQATDGGLPADRALLMFSDYFETLGRLEILAESAIAALSASLSGASRPGGDLQTQGSASARAEAPASALPEQKDEP